MLRIIANQENLKEKIGRRCSLYAISRLVASSFSFENDELRLVSNSDDAAWRTIIESGFEFNGWSPMHPNLGDSHSRTFVPPEDFKCVLVSDAYGTPAGTRFSSILRFRKLTGLMHAIASRDGTYPPIKSRAVGREFLVQFPHRSLSERHISRSDCDTILPRFTADIVLSPTQMAEVGAWYSAAEHCDQACRDRIDKAANFLNRALNAKDIEAYINYFVTLDALFGQRGSVEKSILNGIRELNLGKKFEHKAELLFDLRNELVHGGSRYISEWPKHGKYTQHFRTKPADDVRKLAELAVLGAPHLFSA